MVLLLFLGRWLVGVFELDGNNNFPVIVVVQQFGHKTDVRSDSEYYER